MTTVNIPTPTEIRESIKENLIKIIVNEISCYGECIKTFGKADKYDRAFIVGMVISIAKMFKEKGYQVQLNEYSKNNTSDYIYISISI